MSIITEGTRRYHALWQEALRDAELAHSTPDEDEEWLASWRGRVCHTVWRWEAELFWLLERSLFLSAVTTVMITIVSICVRLENNPATMASFGPVTSFLFINPLWALSWFLLTFAAGRVIGLVCKAYDERAGRAIPSRYEKAMQSARYRREWFLAGVEHDLETAGFVVLSKDQANATFVTSDGVVMVVEDTDGVTGVGLLLNGSPILSGYSHLIEDDEVRTVRTIAGRQIPLRVPMTMTSLRERLKSRV